MNFQFIPLPLECGDPGIEVGEKFLDLGNDAALLV